VPKFLEVLDVLQAVDNSVPSGAHPEDIVVTGELPDAAATSPSAG